MTTVNVSAVTNTVTVTENGSSTVVTVPVTSTVTAVTQGPQGPSGAAAFVFTQPTAAKSGRANESAIQSSMSAVFSTGTFTTADVEEFTAALKFGHLDSIYNLN